MANSYLSNLCEIRNGGSLFKGINSGIYFLKGFGKIPNSRFDQHYLSGNDLLPTLPLGGKGRCESILKYTIGKPYSGAEVDEGKRTKCMV